MKNKTLRCFLLIIGILWAGMALPQSASAATVTDSASDDTTATANAVTMGDTIKGSITETDDLDYYKFTLGSAGCVTLNITSYMQYYCIYLYNSDGEEIWYTNENEYISSVGYRSDTYDLYLEQGSYSMKITGYYWGTSNKSVGSYECSTSFKDSGVTNKESDNSYADANKVTLGNTITGQISENDDYDMFQFSLDEAGCVSLDITSYMRYYCIYLYNSDGTEIWYTDENEWTSSVGYRKDTYDLYLEAGNYYMKITGYCWGTGSKSTGKYTVNTKFTASNTSLAEDNNSFATAKKISWNTSYIGQISINDDFDTYQFEVNSDKTVVVNITSYMKYYCITVFDTAGKEIWNTNDNEWNSDVGYRTDKHNFVLSSGTYYMQINGDKSTGTYRFSLEELSTSNCEHDYEESEVSPTYLKKGYTLHKCTKCGKSYKDNYTAKLKLGQPTIWGTTSRRKATVSWYSVSDATGYQIRYSTNSKFKKSVKMVKVKGKTTKTIKKLKKKKYYFQVRAYKKIGSKTVYGKWSTKKAGKVR